jgi:hypothetical protein
MRDIEVKDIETSRVTVPVGATLAVLVGPIDRQSYTDIRVISGATLQVIGCTFGVTLTAAQLANFVAGGSSANSYQILQTDAQSLRLLGASRFYIADAGATVVVGVIKSRTAQP